MLDSILSLASKALANDSLESATSALHAALDPHGCTYLQSRAYQRPDRPLTPRTHWDAGGFVARFAKTGWVGSEGFRYICIDNNPLIGAIRQGRTRYRFSDFAPHDVREYEEYWAAFSEADIKEALCATAYGSERRLVSFHVGFDRTEFAQGEAEAIQMAALLVAEHFMEEVAHAPPQQPLTRREEDAIQLVAEGKTDWEIGKILGVSETTARFHVDNSRRKLDAVNRSHAVARYFARVGI